MFKPLYDFDAYQTMCKATIISNTENFFVVNQSVFFPLGGGQTGDSGYVKFGNQKITITDTIRNEQGAVCHIVEAKLPADIVGKLVELKIDWERRYKIMKLHTALHVLDKIVPFECTGAKVAAEKAHLDFDMQGNKFDRTSINTLNKVIAEGHVVSSTFITEEDLKRNSELMKTVKRYPPIYDGKVRIVQIGADYNIVDLEPCGGTHVKNTNEIGELVLLKSKSRGRHNRRITVGLVDG